MCARVRFTFFVGLWMLSWCEDVQFPFEDDEGSCDGAVHLLQLGGQRLSTEEHDDHAGDVAAGGGKTSNTATGTGFAFSAKEEVGRQQMEEHLSLGDKVEHHSSYDHSSYQGPGWKERWWSEMAQSWSSLPLAREWSATLSFQAPGNTEWLNGTMAWWSTEDDKGMGPAFKLRFSRFVSKSWIAPGASQVYDELIEYRKGTTTGQGKVQWLSLLEGVKCHPNGNWDMLLLPGMRVVEGEEEWRGRCTTVMAAMHPGRGNVTFCLGSDGVPKFLQIAIDPAFSGETNARMYTISASFHNVMVGPLPGQTFAQPAPCLEGSPPAACPHDIAEPTEELTMYHFTHAPGKNCGLNNLMTNDLHGALAYAGLGLQPNYEFVQVYNVTVRRDFAPLQDCNYMVDQQRNVCTGGFRTAVNAKSVGRSSYSYMEGAFSGQCTDNTLVGSWYSFPSIGECAVGWDVGFQGCTWKTRASKVVSITCMATHCGQLDRDAYKTSGSVMMRSVLDCVTNSIALCPDEKGPMGATCFSRPAAEI